jgi:hypothetical protein
MPLYKQKGDTLSCDNYRGIKLIEYGMKVLEKIVEGRLRKLVSVDEMQFGFMPGKSTIDDIHIVRQVMEKTLKGNKKLYSCFVDLEKAYD